MSRGKWVRIEHAFDGIGPHRPEAGVKPPNEASITALPRRCGFVE